MIPSPKDNRTLRHLEKTSKPTPKTFTLSGFGFRKMKRPRSEARPRQRCEMKLFEFLALEARQTSQQAGFVPCLSVS